MKKMNVKGLIAAPFTPMNEHGELELTVIERYSAKLITDGVAGVFICGTTGEGMLLTDEERKRIAEEWMQYKRDDFKIIVHVGHTSYKSAALLAKHAQTIGADAIATMGPVFLPPNDTNSLVAYCKNIAHAADALPFYYYHMPSVSGVKVPMKVFLNKAENEINNLAGIKFTHFDMMEMQQCMAVSGNKYQIMHGYDEMLLAGLSLGATVAVGSTYNYRAKLYHQIISSFQQGNMEKARNLQQQSVRLVEVLCQFGGGVRAGKAIMKLIGIDCGQCRVPIKYFDKNELQQLEIQLQKMNFFDNMNRECTA